MAISNQKILHIGKRLLRLVLMLVLLLMLVLSITWFVLRSDHPFVIQKIEEHAQTKWNADLELEGYEFQWTKPFSKLRLQVRGLSFAAQNYEEHPVFIINNTTTEFNPWDLVSGDIQVKSLSLDSVWVNIYKDSLDHSNLAFNKKASKKPKKRKSFNWEEKLSELPPLQINFLDFYIQNDFKNKWQRVKLQDPKLQPTFKKDGVASIQLLSKCYFDGLVFNEGRGGFLMDTPGKLDLHFTIADHGRSIELKESSLLSGQNKYFIEGSFLQGNPKHLKLKISNEGVRMSEVMPLLSNKINYALRDVNIDQPIRASFFMDKKFILGRKDVVKVDFETDSAAIQFKDINVSDAKLSGYFSNDCDEDGIGDPATNCISVQELKGDLFDVIPVDLVGQINKLKDPQVDVTGQMDITLPRLNSMLAAKNKVTFLDGHALLDFKYAAALKDILIDPFDEEKVRTNGTVSFENIRLDVSDQKQILPLLDGHLSFGDAETTLQDLSLNWRGSNIHLSGKLSNLPEFLFFQTEALKSDLRLHFDRFDLNQYLNQKDNVVRKGETKNLVYDNLERIAQKVAANINGNIQLEIDELIYDTLFFTDLKTNFKLRSPFQREYADSAMIQIEKLTTDFMGESPITIDIGLYRDSVQKLRLGVHAPSAEYFVNEFLPKGNGINSGYASLDLSTECSLEALFQPKTLLSNLNYKGKVIFDEVEASLSTFPWPVNKMTGVFMFNNNQVFFEDLNFQYKKSPFVLNGQIDDYLFFEKGENKKALVSLQVKGEYLNFREEHIGIDQSKKKESKNQFVPTELFQSLDTIFHYATGKIDFQVDSILTNDHLFKPFIFNVQLIPDDNNPSQHQVMVDSFNFGFGKKNNVKGHLRITNPDAPQVDAQLKMRMKFNRLAKLLPSNYIKLKKGYFKLDLSYQSMLHDTINAENYLLRANIDGEAEIVNGKIYYNYRDFTFDNIYGKMRFDEEALYIPDMKMEVNDNLLHISGQSKDFFPFFILPGRRAHLDLEVSSPSFNFDKFKTPARIGKDSVRVRSKFLAKKPMDETRGIMEKTGSVIDQLLNKGSINMKTDIKEIFYQKFKSSNLKGNISMQPDTVQLKGIQVDIADGNFKIDGSISNIVLHKPKMEMDVQFKENDIREVFRQFEDFGQESLGYKNMKGLASASINFKTDINSNYSILPETMKGDIRFKVSGGELIGVEALETKSGFLFKKRKLEHILIDTIETTVYIRGSDLFIDKFYLHSSSYDFGVQGVYSLGSNNKTRLLLSVPSGNLFRRHLSSDKIKSGKAKRKGMRIHLEARPDKKARMRFFLKWPLFKKSKKKYQLGED